MNKNSEIWLSASRKYPVYIHLVQNMRKFVNYNCTWLPVYISAHINSFKNRKSKRGTKQSRFYPYLLFQVAVFNSIQRVILKLSRKFFSLCTKLTKKVLIFDHVHPKNKIYKTFCQLGNYVLTNFVTNLHSSTVDQHQK